MQFIQANRYNQPKVAKKKNKFGNANNLVNQFAQKTDDGLPF